LCHRELKGNGTFQGSRHVIGSRPNQRGTVELQQTITRWRRGWQRETCCWCGFGTIIYPIFGGRCGEKTLQDPERGKAKKGKGGKKKESTQMRVRRDNWRRAGIRPGVKARLCRTNLGTSDNSFKTVQVWFRTGKMRGGNTTGRAGSRCGEGEMRTCSFERNHPAKKLKGEDSSTNSAPATSDAGRREDDSAS